jgi:hypothetical protein
MTTQSQAFTGSLVRGPRGRVCGGLRGGVRDEARGRVCGGLRGGVRVELGPRVMKVSPRLNRGRLQLDPTVLNTHMKRRSR